MKPFVRTSGARNIPVKGFAVTLSIGVITSFFTAFVITRLIVANWLLKRKPEELPI